MHTIENGSHESLKQTPSYVLTAKNTIWPRLFVTDRMLNRGAKKTVPLPEIWEERFFFA